MRQAQPKNALLINVHLVDSPLINIYVDLVGGVRHFK